MDQAPPWEENIPISTSSTHLVVLVVLTCNSFYGVMIELAQGIRNICSVSKVGLVGSVTSVYMRQNLKNMGYLLSFL